MQKMPFVLGLLTGSLLCDGLTVGVTNAVVAPASSVPTYHACLGRGTLSRVGTAHPQSPHGAVRIWWNARGPEGSPGPKGGIGPKGDAGPGTQSFTWSGVASSQYTYGVDYLPSDATLRVTDAVFQSALASCASPNEIGLSFSAAPTSSSIGWLLAAYDGPQSLSPIKGVDSMESGSGGPLQVGIGSDCPGIVPTSFTIDFTVTPHPTAYH